MTKAHLKRLAVPRTWPTKRKGITFIAKPQAGKDRELSVPLIVFARDMIGKIGTVRECKVLLNNKDITINGRVSRSHRHPVGLFDVVSFATDGDAYRLIINSDGKLACVNASQDSELGLSRVIGKSLVNGKVQLNLLGGGSFLSDTPCKVGDSVIIKDNKISKVLAAKQGSLALLTSGKHIGAIGTIEKIQGSIILFKDGDISYETKKAYAFIIGDTKPEVRITA